MARRSTSHTRPSTRGTDPKWQACQQVLAIRSRRYQADEVVIRP
ncbi:MAG: hypothetical protein QM724_07820 [Flavobacteriales bacterium]